MPKYYEIDVDLSQIKIDSFEPAEVRRQMSKAIARKLRETPLSQASSMRECDYLRAVHFMKGPQDNELSESRVIFVVNEQESITEFGCAISLPVKLNRLYPEKMNMFCFNMDNEVINKSIFFSEDDIELNNPIDPTHSSTGYRC